MRHQRRNGRIGAAWRISDLQIGGGKGITHCGVLPVCTGCFVHRVPNRLCRRLTASTAYTNQESGESDPGYTRYFPDLNFPTGSDVRRRFSMGPTNR